MSDVVKVALEFDDNRLLSALCGDLDRHLERIEQYLGIEVHTRGNTMIVDGSRESVRVASRALRFLWDALRRGEAVAIGEVDAALRLAQATPAASATATLADDVSSLPRQIRTRRRVVSARSGGQQHYLEALRRHELVFCTGPAGTGKTYLAVAQAVGMFISGEVQRIVLVRPAVEAGERLGFLPGDIREKLAPYLHPLYDALYDMLPVDQVERKLQSGEIEVAPLAFMRGRTFTDAFIILDEAQNATAGQLKMFVTRLGRGSRMVITGDLSQGDLPGGRLSGLASTVDLLRDLEGISSVTLTTHDIMRHPLVGRILRAYDDAEAYSSPPSPGESPGVS